MGSRAIRSFRNF
uniref:Uncharacterized protein n=1 Tax=Arundo donax TaxID=35708 RepID=A0A0A9AYP4_ARUDO